MEELKLLVLAAQGGDKDAFGCIVTRFQNMAYAGAYAMLRARQGLRPAIDPLQSRSKLLPLDLLGEIHAAVAIQIQKLFRRYQGLHVAVEHRGLDGLFYLDDRQADELTAIRARRLHRFLTQPFPGLEPWTGLPGQYVNIEDTIQGCQAILDGQYDEVPEEAFYFVGTIDQAVEKAKRL